MEKKDLRDNAFNILKMKYEVHCSNLEWREELNIKLVSGFATLNVVLGAWLSQKPLDHAAYQIAFTAFVVVLTGAVAMLVHRNYNTRQRVVDTILSINEALKFDEPEIYKEDTLDPPRSRPLPYWRGTIWPHSSSSAQRNC